MIFFLHMIPTIYVYLWNYPFWIGPVIVFMDIHTVLVSIFVEYDVFL